MSTAAVSDKAAPCPLDQVNRAFHALAPNMLWVLDFALSRAVGQRSKFRSRV